MFCGGCGNDVPAGSKFCQKCGRPVVSDAAAAPLAAAPPPVPYQAAPAQPPFAPPPPAYAPPPQTVYAGAAQVAPVHYGGFWIRFVAYLLDSVIIGIPLSIILVILFLAFGGMALFHGAIAASAVSNPDPEAALAAATPMLGAILAFYAIAIFGGFVITWLYFAGLESSARQATFGKSVMGMRVTDLNGNRISFGRASGRYFGKIISGMILDIGFIMAGFTEKKQALHDMIAGTLVMRR